MLFHTLITDYQGLNAQRHYKVHTTKTKPYMHHFGFLGMSGAGKSHWSKKMADAGWHLIDVDDLIHQRIEKELNCTFANKIEAGKWLGFPHEPTYSDREAIYRRTEFELLTEINEDLEQGKFPTKTVFDFGGSIIYTGDILLQKLAKQLTFIYLQVSPFVYEQLCNAYLQNPPAVIWNGQFIQNPGETLQMAFAQSYPRLIQSRLASYEKYAQKTFSYEWHRAPNQTIEAFLTAIEQV